MCDYELILLFDPSLGEEKIDQLLARIGDKIKGQGGEVGSVEKWGTKRLASMLKKAKSLTQAYYVLVRFRSAPSLPAELRGFLKVNENVVRYFISRAVVVEAPSEVVAVREIKGEPLGESK